MADDMKIELNGTSFIAKMECLQHAFRTVEHGDTFESQFNNAKRLFEWMLEPVLSDTFKDSDSRPVSRRGTDVEKDQVDRL